MKVYNLNLRAILIMFCIITIGVFSAIFAYVLKNSVGTEYWYFSIIMLLPILVALFTIFVARKYL